MPAIPFDNTYARLPERFYVKQEPARVPGAGLVKVNGKLAEQLGIDADWLVSPEGVAMLAGNSLPDGAEPLAQAYAGHQFGGFVPQLGDGRALLLGEVIDTTGQRRDIQLKGSGRTPFSRNGDGKSALGPVIREYIVSEAMHALGVPTTRALGAVTTGEGVLRQEGPLPGGVFTRVAASHIRVGTFQYFAARRDTEAVRALADYAIARHYPECLCTADPAPPYAAFLKSMLQAQAKLVAQWMSLGFIHGVMNTDNTSVSGETIDYGPCAFMDVFHPQCVFSSIDRQARYAWGNQPNIALWNLTRLAETLLPLLDEKEDQAMAVAEDVLSGFSAYFADQYMTRFRAKFGLTTTSNDDVIQLGLSLIANQQVDFTLFFRLLTNTVNNGDSDYLSALFPDKEAFKNWFKQWQGAVDADKGLQAMQAANPILIPRNHRVEQAIQGAYAGDYAPFHRLTGALENPYQEQAQYADLEAPPKACEIVTETFCGT
ncbi:MAG: YdiU family protein [Akkermansiaceae bacterium]|nr:YdiU family protein [Akkermansiaceae bacterium]